VPRSSGDENRRSGWPTRRRSVLGVGAAVLLAAAFLAAPARNAQAAGPAQLSIDLDQPLRYISPQLFGSNVDWNSEFDFLEPGTNQFYPRFLSQVASIGYGALRFPGGTLGSFYHWERAIGPVADRQPNTFFGDGAEPSLFGPDEFGQLLTTAGAVGDVIVNPSTGTLAEAADWVAYMTTPAPDHPVSNPADPQYWAWLRARDGHPAPFDVPWWEVGNEVNVGSSTNPGWMDGSLVSYANPHCANSSVLACLYDFGGTTGFTDQPVGDLADTSPSAALSTGAPGLVKYVVYAPVVPGSLSLTVAGQPWTEVTSLAGAGPASTVYELDPATGQVTFGDGAHGAIPPAGAQIDTSYQSGPHPGFVEYYRAMKAVNPAIRVCLGASSVTPDIGAYLQDLGSRYPYDCVPTHPYVRDGDSLAQGEISNSLPESEYDVELLALPQVLAGQVQHVRQEIDQYAGPRAARVTIPVTEFGQLRSSAPSFDPSTFHLSLQEGILTALQLQQWINLGVPMAEHYLLEGAPFGSLAPPGTSGANVNDNSEIVGPGPDTIEEPPALVEKLFRELGGQRQVAVASQQVPTIALPDGSALPALETTASARGNQVTILVVNQSDTTTVPATITASAGHLRSATLTTLDAASELAYNTVAEPATVGLSQARLDTGSGPLTVTFPAHSVSLIRIVTG
jgi:alpha-L-arabinofuranosidase